LTEVYLSTCTEEAATCILCRDKVSLQNTEVCREKETKNASQPRQICVQLKKKKIRITASSASNVKGNFNFIRHYVVFQLGNSFYYGKTAYKRSEGEKIKYA